MDSDAKPYRLPSPVIVGDLLARASWDDDISDDHRLVCEMGADTVRILMMRIYMQAKRLEQLEASICAKGGNP